MRCYPALGYRLLSPGDSLKHSHPLLHELIALNVHQVRTWKAVLSDENWLLVASEVSEELGGLALEGGDEFGTHEVTLQYHSEIRKCLGLGPNAQVKPNCSA